MAVAVLTGVAAGFLVTPFLGLAAGLLAAWGALSLVSTVWILLVTWRMDAAQTRAHATEEDPGRRIARLIAVTGSFVSIAAVLVVVLQARHAHGWTQFALAGIAVLSVAASWGLIQTDYMLRYAKLYYDGSRGISFNQDEDPQYTDFAYFSVGLGMTYQVADTNVTRNAIRRIVIAQTTIAYVFGALILGTIINLVTGLG
ncbi:Uncharacterized membrane protein [Microbacterium azadirachtae]|jgi:uncharacterized membrane protein|uniref:Uncharacterized membrane protein n=1 Tax=Microbacterium azadirachtae TaxID=582680 RepID=A0A1I6IK27_9MICO|nr:DUF1345 domain-containing protein [Microbacterium azadirachtae]SFR67041.1 Uncharacterized membrane protein [Microbacterium azadirachtae]